MPASSIPTVETVSINEQRQTRHGQHGHGLPGSNRGAVCLLDGELKDPKSIENFEHHMSHCRSCYSRAEIENQLTDRLRAASGSHASEQLKKRPRNLIDEF